ncbi:50S ribosomal protein L21 [Buchnera aphidicola]|uniref:Large ribosomal subunit protein bL21 n=1 Tax=Buchnera aphidicola subsp. Tuberolachnus salignus TaxID=98804 RepID=A0A160SWM0_BUCTT|nr:50S ribosomal protein L21 [Buchnera aphidicola]CUR53232.1 50S ribosomal protein L21 [Buchnera aphidicola (Tuberolachnus salignus)]
MYAILQDRNKQYKVQIGQIIRIEKINKKIGKKIFFKNVLLINNLKNTFFGSPTLKNAYIIGIIKKHQKDKKIKIIKFKRRKHYQKTQGHRQKHTTIVIKEIFYQH